MADGNDVYSRLLEQRLTTSGAISNVVSDCDDPAWDSMAVIASEQWSKGEEDEFSPQELIPNGHKVLTPTERCELFLTAAQFGKLDLVQDLYRSYGDQLLLHRDEDGYSALHRASYNGHLQVVGYLLTIGADISACTEDDWQPLHCACRWNKASVASLLLQNGAVVNVQTKGGQTPLHLAASNDQARDTLQLLLTTRGVDATIRNGGGETARDLAMSYGRLGYLFEMTDDCLKCSP